MNRKTRRLGTDRTEDHRGDRFAWHADIPYQAQVDRKAEDGVGPDRDRWRGVGCRKIATDEGGCILSISAEFEDAKTIAQKTGVPVREVMRRIVDLAWIVRSEGAGDSV